jgi:2-polyprenyl-3-methyl-5-hydroxy-6-metoxy-1,4-benzoquinol methylase
MTGFNNPQAHWDKRFSTPDYVFGEEPNAFLVSQAALLGKGQALAIADGEGRNSVWLARQGLSVDAFDFSAPAIAKAQALAAKHQVKVNFSCSAWQDFDWQPGRYDLVAGIFFQFATPDERAVLFEKIKGSLKPGGLLIIQGYGKNQLKYNTGGPGKLDHLYDEDLLRQAFAGFEVQVCETYETSITEGAGHSGMSALVGFVARKP